MLQNDFPEVLDFIWVYLILCIAEWNSSRLCFLWIIKSTFLVFHFISLIRLVDLFNHIRAIVLRKIALPRFDQIKLWNVLNRVIVYCIRAFLFVSFISDFTRCYIFLWRVLLFSLPPVTIDFIILLFSIKFVFELDINFWKL